MQIAYAVCGSRQQTATANAWRLYSSSCRRATASWSRDRAERSVARCSERRTHHHTSSSDSENAHPAEVKVCVLWTLTNASTAQYVLMLRCVEGDSTVASNTPWHVAKIWVSSVECTLRAERTQHTLCQLGAVICSKICDATVAALQVITFGIQHWLSESNLFDMVFKRSSTATGLARAQWFPV